MYGYLFRGTCTNFCKSKLSLFSHDVLASTISRSTASSNSGSLRLVPLTNTEDARSKVKERQTRYLKRLVPHADVTNLAILEYHNQSFLDVRAPNCHGQNARSPDRQMAEKSSSKRFRACDPCHSIKIKCELGSKSGDPPCARCVRLGKDCIVTPPKRQKDRVAELEAQVESLSKLLESQKLGATPSDSGDGRSPGTFERTPVDSKKRRLEDTDIHETSAESEVDDIDQVVDLATQKTIYHKYVNEIIPRFTLVPIPQPYDYDTLRRNEPLLLQAVIYAGCLGVLPPDAQDQVGKILAARLMEAIESEVKSIWLVSAIQLTSLWYRFPKLHSNLTPQLLAQLAVDVSTDIGIAGSERPSKSGRSTSAVQADGIEARKSWLASYLGSTFHSVILRMKIADPVVWTFHEDTALLVLEYSADDSVDNRLLAQYGMSSRL